MATISEELAAAVEHHKAGRLHEAENLYRHVLALDPKQADALHLLGVIAHQVGRHDVAAELIKDAIGLDAGKAEYHTNLGEAYRAQRKFKDAIASYRRALELKPDSPGMHHNMGLAFNQLGEFAEAAACYRKALEYEPHYAEAYHKLGHVLEAQQQLGEATACFEKALQLRPDFDAAALSLANILKEQGRLAEAIAVYQRSLQLSPDNADVYNNLGIALSDAGKVPEAIACYHQALQLRPDFAEVYNNFGNALVTLGRTSEAVACYRRSLDLNPDFAEAHNNLGNALMDQGMLAEAIDCYERTLELKPDTVGACMNLGFAFKAKGRVAEAIGYYRKALALKPDYVRAHSNLVYATIFSPDYDARAILEENRRWDREHAQPLAKCSAPHPNDPAPERPLRIGYVSPDFRRHCQAFFTVPLLSTHDHQNFKIFCYADVLVPDAITAKLRSFADTWRPIVGITDDKVSEIIRKDEIDILVDLTMHMDRSRLLVFARKPAPVQVCWLAYPGTTGMTAMDYRLSDPYLDPPGIDESIYAEKTIRLPNSFWCYDPLTNEPAVNPLPALTNGFVTFGCFNNFWKLNSQVLSLWAVVLRAVEGSRFILLAPEDEERASMLAHFEKEGVAPERVSFVAKRPRPEYLEFYHRVDLCLDTLPANGHTTSLDAAWMGIPVLTMPGRTVLGRAGVSQLTNLGLTEFIAHSPDDMARIASNIASDLPRLSALRATMRQRMKTSPLMDAHRFTRAMESAFREMWRLWTSKTQ